MRLVRAPLLTAMTRMAFESDQSVAAFYSDQSEGAFTWAPAREISAYGADGNTCTADAQDDGVVHIVLPRAHGRWFSSQPNADSNVASEADDALNEQAAIEADFDACTLEALHEAANCHGRDDNSRSRGSNDRRAGG